MTIDKAIKIFIREIECLPHAKCEDCTIEAYGIAIDTMRKYQKIEQIINSNPVYIHHTDMDTYKLNSIRGVVEDE